MGFTDQDEQRDALIHMNGFRGMGEKPIKVSMAIPKKKPGKEDEVGSKGGAQYSYYYESYWADQAAWGNYASLPGVKRAGHAHFDGHGKQFIANARNNAGNSDPY